MKIDGSMYLTTRCDALFLAIPFLEISKKKSDKVFFFCMFVELQVSVFVRGILIRY